MTQEEILGFNKRCAEFLKLEILTTHSKYMVISVMVNLPMKLKYLITMVVIIRT